MSKRCLTCGMHSEENKVLKARLKQLEEAALAVIEDAQKKIYLMGHDTSPAMIRLAALLGGGE